VDGFQGDGNACAMGDLQETQRLIRAGSFSLKLGFCSDNTMLLSADPQQFEHFTLVAIH
jgi:hypothetical protein